MQHTLMLVFFTGSTGYEGMKQRERMEKTRGNFESREVIWQMCEDFLGIGRKKVRRIQKDAYYFERRDGDFWMTYL